MNEELKIIIKAVADEAKRELEAVKKELEDIKKQGEETGKSVDSSMKKIGKAAAVAVGAITAVTAAMTALGKSAQDVNKGFGKLKSSFENAGSSAKEATKYYKELFGVIGDHDRTIETGQSLARVTTDPTALSDYKNIMAGVVSQYGDGYNTEALAENISETIAAAKVTGDLERVLIEAGISADAFNNALMQATSTEERELLVRSTLNGVLGNAGKAYIAANQGTIQYNETQARLNITLAQAASYTTPLLTALSNLAATALQELKPALETISAVLIVFVKWIVAAIKAIGSFFGAFKKDGVEAGSALKETTKTVETIGGLTKGTGGLGLAKDFKNANKEAQKLKKQLMGFDELNIVSSQTSASVSPVAGAGAGVGAIEIPPIEIPQIDTSDFGLDGFKETVEEVEEKIKGIVTLAGIAGAAFLTWKLTNFIKDLKDGKIKTKDLKNNLKSIGGTMLIVAGAVSLVSGYSDAWANGIDWGNFALILGGIGAIVGGLVLAVSPLAGAIATIAGGIAMVVLGIKDLVTNGYSMEAVIMVAVGAITILVGVLWAFNAALLANPITWVVAAIIALIAIFVVLWNECDGFRQFWIDLWDIICDAFDAVVEWLGDAVDAIVQFFKDAWEWIKDAWSAVGEFFSGVWDSICNAFAAVGTWFKDIFKKAWEGIKSIFSGVGSFFSGIWDKIKSIFSSIGQKVGDAFAAPFKKVINWILDKAVGLINGFISGINWAIGVINKIPGVEISKIAKLEVPQFAKGGVVNSATLGVFGEAGKEAVIPLENNTEWMDILAERIATRNSAPTKIVLTLDGKELGWANINSINQVTKQTGKLQLALA